MHQQARPYGRSDNDFLGDKARGERVERAVAAMLMSYGLSVEVVEKGTRDRFEDRARFSDDGLDLLVEGMPVQVKGRFGYAFSNVATFPFETARLDSQYGWDRHHDKVVAYLLASGRGSGVVAATTPWRGVVVSTSVDPTRGGAIREFVDIPRDHLMDIGLFVAWIRKVNEEP